ncbi:MAG: hypothetical protein ABIR96_12490, partial [Bdellovibrionota bacterium]
MRLFLKSRLTWSLVPLLSCALISPSARAVDTAALASTAVQGAMSMAMLSAMDTGFSAADCVCNADSTTCKTGAAGFCAALALNVVSMALGVAQALAAGNTQSAVQGQDGAGGYDANGNKIDVPTIPPFTPTTIPNTFKAECAKPNPPKYLCENNGFELAKIDLTKLKTLTETGKVVLTPEQLAGIDSAEKKIAAIQKGDYAGALGAAGAANGSDFSDYASQTSGRAGSAGALSSP